MLLSKYPILSKELIPYESTGNMSVAYRLKIRGKVVLVINNHSGDNRIEPGRPQAV